MIDFASADGYRWYAESVWFHSDCPWCLASWVADPEHEGEVMREHNPECPFWRWVMTDEEEEAS